MEFSGLHYYFIVNVLLCLGLSAATLIGYHLAGFLSSTFFDLSFYSLLNNSADPFRSDRLSLAASEYKYTIHPLMCQQLF